MIFDFSKVPNWTFISYADFEMSIALDALRILLANQERTLTEQQEKLEKLINEDEYLRDTAPEEQGSYYSHYYESEERVIDDLRRMQRYGLCLSIYSFCEGRLQSICDNIDNQFKFRIKVDDLSGTDNLMRFWNYFEKVYEIDNRSVEPFFTPLKQQRIVRNIIAHQDGFVKQEQKKKIELKTGIRIEESGNDLRIDLYSSKYNLYLLKKVEDFFESLFIAIDKRYTELKRQQEAK